MAPRIGLTADLFDTRGRPLFGEAPLQLDEGHMRGRVVPGVGGGDVLVVLGVDPFGAAVEQHQPLPAGLGPHPVLARRRAGRGNG